MMRRRLAALLAVVGVLLIVEAALAIVWQEPFSALYTKREQAALEGELARLERAARAARAARASVEPRRVALGETATKRLGALARSLRRGAARGQPVGRLAIPKVGARFVVVAGVDAASLRRAPGHYRFTGLPGENRTVGIAGHRTTYLAPFRDLDELRRGDTITLSMPYGRFRYAVERTRIVSPDAVSVLRTVGYERLVLTACHPPFSDAQRIVVFARLVDRT